MKSARILVVEDEPSIAEGISALLGSGGYPTVMIASSGEQAVSIAREHQPDVVLMDICLSGEIDGIDAAAQITRQGGPRPIYITAFTDENLMKRALETDPLGYVVKPFPERELFAAVEIGLRHSRRTDAEVDRLSSLGRLSVELSHHLNNHLTIIQGATKKIRSLEIDDHSRQKWLTHIERTVNRTQSLVKGLDVGLWQAGNDIGPVELNSALTKVMDRLENAYPDKQLHFTKYLNFAPVAGNQSMIEHALYAMGVNAFEAVEKTGRQGLVEFVLATEAVSDNDARFSPSLVSGTYARISIIDTGIGINPEHRKKLFEPFFTTKDNFTAASGLDLWSVYWVIRSHGGQILVESEVGRGTTFDVYLPVAHT